MDIVALDLINGLPAHPLIVHAAVVLVPLTALFFIVLVIFPKLQKNYLNLVVLFAVLGTGSSLAAKQSGEELAERVGLPVEHAQFGERLVIVSGALLALIVAFKFLTRSESDAKNLLRIVGVVGALVAIVAIVLTYQTGNSGAKSVWEDRIAGVTEATPSATPSESAAETTGISLAEVALHNTPEDCWSVVNGKVYDLTKFVSQHPGGADKISGICGRDGTSAFNGQHRGEDTPVSTLGNYLIGDLAK